MANFEACAAFQSMVLNHRASLAQYRDLVALEQVWFKPYLLLHIAVLPDVEHIESDLRPQTTLENASV